MFTRMGMFAAGLGMFLLLPFSLQAEDNAPKASAARFSSFEEFLLSRNNVIKLTDEQVKGITESYNEYRDAKRANFGMMHKRNQENAPQIKRREGNMSKQGYNRGEGRNKREKKRDPENCPLVKNKQLSPEQCDFSDQRGMKHQGYAGRGEGRRSFCSSGMFGDRDGKLEHKQKGGFWSESRKGYDKGMGYLRRFIYSCIDDYMQGGSNNSGEGCHFNRQNARCEQSNFRSENRGNCPYADNEKQPRYDREKFHTSYRNNIRKEHDCENGRRYSDDDGYRPQNRRPQHHYWQERD